MSGEQRCSLPSTCRAQGDVCTQDADCCTGVCGPDGTCPVLAECDTAGEPCTGYHECCSGLCADPGNEVPICQFVSGCRPIGEVCHDPADCCGELCQEYQGTGVYRCVKPAGCMSAGEVCWEGQSANCCPQGPSGGNQLCIETIMGVPRCWDEGTPSNCIADGQPCSFSDECCGGVCAPDENGNLVCGSTCIPLTGACTVDADCCDAGLCIGGSCSPNNNDCQPIGGACTEATDCCSGECDTVNGVCVGPY
jgi:hypothetical protein